MGEGIEKVYAPKSVEKSSIAIVSVSEEGLAQAFTEWDRRYRDDPKKFMSEAEHLLRETPYTYGQACAPYFVSILQSQGCATITNY